jgi:hypothetical protein
MNMYVKTAIAATLGFGLSFSVLAADSAGQGVGVQVDPINEISVSGSPGNLVINTATAGQQPVDASDNSTTYDITTNETNKKITAELDVAMPANTSLTVTLGAPTGASSSQVTLTETAQDAVTGISTLAETGLGIGYVMSADVTAGTFALDSKTVTFTITE